MSNTAANLIALLFLARDLTHRAHLKTTSYAQHVALNEFYDAIVGFADTFAETYQGMKGIIANIPLADATGTGDIVAVLKQQVEWIETNRSDFASNQERPLQNIIDEICGQYYSTLYKLENLK